MVTTPALFLARPPDAMVPLGQGILSLAQLQDRLVLAAREAGFIGEDDFEATRARTAHLPMDTQTPTQLPTDPAELLALLRQLSAARSPPPRRPPECAGPALPVLVAAAALPVGVQANLSGQMDVMFDTLINVTDPTAHLGQRRGVLDGGSVVTRARIMNESLIQVVPPSLSAGCGGIDLFAGSFSFINADQFQDLLRAIAANAAGYAFEVALQNMCKTCADTMNYLQKVVQALNQGLGNSCQLAKGLVNAGADALNLAHKDKTSLETMTGASRTPSSRARPSMAPAPPRRWRRAIQPPPRSSRVTWCGGR